MSHSSKLAQNVQSLTEITDISWPDGARWGLTNESNQLALRNTGISRILHYGNLWTHAVSGKMLKRVQQSDTWRGSRPRPIQVAIAGKAAFLEILLTGCDSRWWHGCKINHRSPSSKWHSKDCSFLRAFIWQLIGEHERLWMLSRYGALFICTKANASDPWAHTPSAIGHWSFGWKATTHQSRIKWPRAQSFWIFEN